MALRFKEPEKITIPITCDSGDFSLICKPIQAPRFIAVMHEHHEYFQKIIDGRDQLEGTSSGYMSMDLLPTEAYMKDVNGIMESLVVDWQGVTDDDDKPLEYSFEKLKTLSDYDISIYTQFIMTATTLVNKMAWDKARESEKNLTGSAQDAH